MDALVAAADAASPPPPPHSRLSTEQRWSIVVLHKHGWSNKRIAEDQHCDRHTVRAVLARYAATGTVGSGARSGRPRCTDEALDTAIAFTARVDVFTSARQVRRKLDLDCSDDTVDRRLQEAGLFGRVARHKRDYSERELRLRLAFAEGYKGWSAEKWEHVLFSDEKTFYGKGFCGRIWVRRERGTALEPQYTVHKVAHPVKTNVWACFCAAGQGYAKLFHETMDAARMKSILSTELLPSARLHFDVARAEEWWLLHDNDKKFRSLLVSEWLHNNGVQCIDFPPYSPDLNPIENLWAVLARACEKRACDTEDELDDAIATEWSNIDKNLLKELAHSLPARIAAVIAADGWHTKY